MKKLLNTILLSLVLSFSVTDLNAQNNREMDNERLVNDLRIMEGILDKLLTPSGNTFFSSGSGSQGFYLPGYGVIFTVPTSSPLRGSLFVLPKIARVLRPSRAPIADDDENDNAYSFSFGFGESEDDDERSKRLEESEKKELERISSKVSDFLGIYSDAIGQINEKDKIAVYLYNSSNQSPEHLFHVLKKDIIHFKSNKIKSKTFNKRIHYTSLMKNDDMSSQIDIMSFVLNTSLKTPSSGGYNFRKSNINVNGLYLDGFGALFIINNQRNSLSNNFLIIESQLERVRGELARVGELELFYSDKEKDEKMSRSERKKEQVSTLKKAYEKDLEEYRKSIDEYKLSFASLLGNYGHTLRLVNDAEWIGVITNWQNSNYRRQNSNRNNALIMKVLKKDVDKFDSGRISKEDFFKKIGYTEY